MGVQARCAGVQGGGGAVACVVLDGGRCRRGISFSGACGVRLVAVHEQQHVAVVCEADSERFWRRRKHERRYIWAAEGDFAGHAFWTCVGSCGCGNILSNRLELHV